MKKIKIGCLGNDLSGGGAERVQLELLKLLDRDRFAIEVAYLRNCGSLDQLLPPHVTPVFFAQGEIAFSKITVSAFRQYRALARDADLLFGMMDGLPIYLAAIVGKLEHKPSVGWVHNTVSKMFLESNRLHRFLAPQLYPRTTQLVCVSDGVREDLQQFGNFQNHPITIYNPIDIDQVRLLAAEALPEPSRFWYDKPVVIGVGRLVKQKRMDRLIEAFASAVRLGLDANLILLGQGQLKSELDGLATELGIAPRVFFAGFQPNPYPYIRAASVLALSSEYEGLPTVLLEAMALGTPIVSVDCPSGPREILEGGRNGILVQQDVEALAGGIREMLCDQSRRHAYIQNGLIRAEHFRSERIVKSFESLFRRLV